MIAMNQIAGAYMNRQLFFVNVNEYNDYCNEYSKFIVTKNYNAETRQANISFNF